MLNLPNIIIVAECAGCCFGTRSSRKKNKEVGTEILKSNVVELDELDELDEDDEIIYQDMNLEEIAEILAQVSVVDLYANLTGYAGSMGIVKVNEMFYLIN